MGKLDAMNDQTTELADLTSRYRLAFSVYGTRALWKCSLWKTPLHTRCPGNHKGVENSRRHGGTALGGTDRKTVRWPHGTKAETVPESVMEEVLARRAPIFG